jgi:hypothetical protein
MSSGTIVGELMTGWLDKRKSIGVCVPKHGSTELYSFPLKERSEMVACASIGHAVVENCWEHSARKDLDITQVYIGRSLTYAP